MWSFCFSVPVCPLCDNHIQREMPEFLAIISLSSTIMALFFFKLNVAFELFSLLLCCHSGLVVAVVVGLFLIPCY